MRCGQMFQHVGGISPFGVIKALHVLQLALVLSFLVKYNQTLDRFCLDAILETFCAQIRGVHMT